MPLSRSQHKDDHDDRAKLRQRATEISYVEHAYIEPKAGYAEMVDDTFIIRA